MTRIPITYEEETFIPGLWWMSRSIKLGVAEWVKEEDNDDDLVACLNPYGEVVRVTEKKIRKAETLGLSMRRL